MQGHMRRDFISFLSRHCFRHLDTIFNFVLFDIIIREDSESFIERPPHKLVLWTAFRDKIFIHFTSELVKIALSLTKSIHIPSFSETLSCIVQSRISCRPCWLWWLAADAVPWSRLLFNYGSSNPLTNRGSLLEHLLLQYSRILFEMVVRIWFLVTCMRSNILAHSAILTMIKSTIGYGRIRSIMRLKVLILGPGQERSSHDWLLWLLFLVSVGWLRWHGVITKWWLL